MNIEYNPVMMKCPECIFGTLIRNDMPRATNTITFGLMLSSILSELGTHHITSSKSTGYVYFIFRFKNKEYDLRDKQQFLKLRDTVINAYNDWLEFFKNKGKK